MVFRVRRLCAIAMGVSALVACGIDVVGLGLTPEVPVLDASTDDAMEQDVDARGTGDLRDAAADADADAATPPCVGMVHITSGAKPYCIDGIEVTEGRYASFLASMSDAGALLAGVCSFKTAFRPGSARGAARPVSDVDWCDARAFCAWDGKRLCTTAEWQNACNDGTGTVYPYGDTFDASVCNGEGYGGPIDGGSLPGCRGPRPVYDMSGNVDEWSSGCTGDAGAADTCTTHGGDWSDPGASQELQCKAVTARSRDAVISFIGFRCCRPIAE